MKKNKRVFVDSNSMTIHAAVIFMALSAVFRIAGSFGLWNDTFFTVTQLIMPLACNVLFILIVMLLGKKAFFMTCLPVVIGCAYMLISSFNGGSFIASVVEVILYASAAILFCCTVFGWIGTKWLVTPLFIIILIYCIITSGLPALSNPSISVTFSSTMHEISLLLTLAAFFFASAAMKNKLPLEETGLPKMKEPKVIAPTFAAASDEDSALPETVEEQSTEKAEENLSEQEPSSDNETLIEGQDSGKNEENLAEQESLSENKTAIEEHSAKNTTASEENSNALSE